MSKIIYIQSSNLYNEPRNVGDVVEVGNALFNSKAAIPVQLGLAVALPESPSAPVIMNQQAFEYLLVRAGVLPEPYQVESGKPFITAMRGA